MCKSKHEHLICSLYMFWFGYTSSQHFQLCLSERAYFFFLCIFVSALSSIFIINTFFFLFPLVSLFLFLFSSSSFSINSYRSPAPPLRVWVGAYQPFSLFIFSATNLCGTYYRCMRVTHTPNNNKNKPLNTQILHTIYS